MMYLDGEEQKLRLHKGGGSRGDIVQTIRK